MSWITIIWSGIAGACITVAGFLLLMWAKSRHSWSYLLIGLAALGGAGLAAVEMTLMRAQTPAQYGELIRAYHVPVFVVVVTIVWFIRSYLGAGRLWLAWLITGVRVLVLILTFSIEPNLNFIAITDLRAISFLGETAVIPVGIKNPLTNITNVSSLLFLIFVLDAAVSAWRSGSHRRASVIGITFGTAIAVAILLSEMNNRGILPIPLTLGVLFLLILTGIGFELSVELLRANQLTRDLLQSEKRLSLATSSADVGVWEWDVERDAVWVTDTVRKRMGLSGNERLNVSSVLGRVHSDDRDAIEQLLRDISNDPKDFELEYRLVDANNAIRRMKALAFVECNPAGKLRLVRGVTLDITERHQYEETLRESEERFRNVANSAPVLIWMSDTEKSCNYFNKGWLDYTGRTMMQETGNGWVEGVHPDDVGHVLDTYTASFDKRLAFTMQYRLRKHDGRYGWVADTGVPRFAEDGEFLGYIGSCIEVTAQKEAEERYRESAEFNETVLASLDSQIAILDRRGIIVAVNDAWKAFARENQGQSSSVGVDYLDVCKRTASSDLDAERALTGILSVLEGASDYFEMEYPCHSPSRFRSFLMRVVPLQTAAGGAVISHTEVTRLRLAEMEVTELQRDLAHVQRVSAMGQLAAALAHEINQPLGAILRNTEAAELFLQKSPPDLEELREIIMDIRSDERRASAVIGRMRSLLKRGDLLLETLVVKDLVGQVVMLLHAEVQRHGTTVRVDVPPDLPRVKGDRIHLQQVILNLLMNSMEAADEKSNGAHQIVIRASQTEGGMVELAVIDNGNGIPPGELPHLFQPFFTTKPQGTGIGLAVSETIVEAHGGRITAENNPECGATFRFTLTIAEQGG